MEGTTSNKRESVVNIVDARGEGKQSKNRVK